MHRCARTLLGVGIVAAVVVGCGGDDDDPLALGSATQAEADPSDGEPSEDGGPAAGDPDAPDDPPADEPDPADDLLPVEPTPEEDPAGGVDDVGCVVGTWELDAEYFVKELNEAAGGSLDGGTLEFAGGRYVVELGADGSYFAAREGFALRVSTPEGAVVITVDDQVTGSYTIDDVEPGDFEATMSIQETASEATTSLAFEQNGQLVPLPAGIPTTFDIPIPSLAASATYVCFADEELTVGTIDENGDVFLAAFVPA